MPLIQIDNHQGMSARIAPEKLPIVVYELLENLVLSIKDRHLRKRPGYGVALTGLTNIRAMTELVDKNGNRGILIDDNGTLKRSEYSGGYQTPSSIANDKRTAGSTIHQFAPVNAFKEVRSGAGVAADGNRPLWFGYMPTRERFNGAESVDAGRYLTDQYPDWMTDLGITFVKEVGAGSVASEGLAVGNHALYLSPVFDGKQVDVDGILKNRGGQKGFPESSSVLPQYFEISAAQGFAELSIVINEANAGECPRLTGIDVFFAVSEDHSFADIDVEIAPAYYWGRISMNEDSDPFCSLNSDDQTFTLTAPDTIQINDITVWKTFKTAGFWIHDPTNNKNYYCSSEVVSSPNVTITLDTTIGDAIPLSPSSPTRLEFFSRWAYLNPNYSYTIVYEDFYKQLAKRMDIELGIPEKNTGIEDFRYRYGDVSGGFYAAVGFDESEFGYFSVGNNPDVIPEGNFFKVRHDPRAVIGLVDGLIMVPYKGSTDLIQIFGNERADRRDTLHDKGLVGNKAYVKLSDTVIVAMGYNGPWIYDAGRHDFIGEDLREWWMEKLTDTHKEACVVAHDHRNRKVLFSFPTYAVSPYTAGIVFCYDLEAVRLRKLPWTVFKSDRAIKAACLADDLHLLTTGGAQIEDRNSDVPSEGFSTRMRLALLQSTDFRNRIDLANSGLSFTDAGGNALTVKAFKNNGALPVVSGTVTADKRNYPVHTTGNTVQVELESADGTDDFTLKTIILEASEAPA